MLLPQHDVPPLGYTHHTIVALKDAELIKMESAIFISEMVKVPYCRVWLLPKI
jgi:hypothetical protein